MRVGTRRDTGHQSLRRGAEPGAAADAAPEPGGRAALTLGARLAVSSSRPAASSPTRARRPPKPVARRGAGLRRRREVRRLSRRGGGRLPRLRPRSRDAGRHGPDGLGQLRARPASATGRRPRSSVATASSSCAPRAPTASRGSSRSPTRSASRSAPAVPHAVPGRAAPGARPRLGHAAPRGRAASAGSPLYPDVTLHGPGSPPLDGAGADVELPVRRVPLDGSPEAVRPGDESVRDDVGRAHRVVRGVPRAGLGSRRVGREAPRGRAARDARRHRPRRGTRDGATGVERQGHQRGIAEWTGAPRTSTEVDMCARCHARRRPIADPHSYGRPFLDTHVPALLEARLYHADGQILGEVYEWGSFVQSRMQRAGVTCSDCHEPHRGTLRAPGNGVCAQCHLPAKFDTPTHHRHGGRLDGRPLRELPHAGAHVHGGGSAAGPQSPHPAPRPVGGARHPERLHRLSPRSRAPVGRRARRGLGGPGPRRRRRLRAGRSTPRGAGARTRGRR